MSLFDVSSFGGCVGNRSLPGFAEVLNEKLTGFRANRNLQRMGDGGAPTFSQNRHGCASCDRSYRFSYPPITVHGISNDAFGLSLNKRQITIDLK